MHSFAEKINLISIEPEMIRFLSGILFIIVILLPIAGLYLFIITKASDRSRKIFDRFLRIIIMLVLVIFCIEIAISLITEHQVNKNLGFNYSTPELPEGEVFLLTKVTPGMPMDNAGLKPYDQVLMNSTMRFYRLLIDNRGREAEFKVLRDEKEIAIRVRVPEMQLLLRRGNGDKKDG